MRKIIIPLVLTLTVFAVLFAGTADAAHHGGEGHGEGIDVVYMSGEQNILTVSLASLPSDKITISVFTPSTGDYQYVGPVEESKLVRIFVNALIIGTHEVSVTITNTGALVAECELIVGETVTLSYSANGGTGYTPGSEVVPGESVKLTESQFTPPEGKAFKAWKISGTEYQPGQTVKVSEDTVAEAVWTDLTCRVTFDPNGGTGSIQPMSVTYGNTITLPECTFTAPDDKSFSSWNVYGKSYKAGESVVIKGDTVISAQWSSGFDFTFIAIIAAIVLLAVIAVIVLLRRH